MSGNSRCTKTKTYAIKLIQAEQCVILCNLKGTNKQIQDCVVTKEFSSVKGDLIFLNAQLMSYLASFLQAIVSGI